MPIRALSRLLRNTRDPILRASLEHRLSVALRRANRAGRERMIEHVIASEAGISKPWLAAGGAS